MSVSKWKWTPECDRGICIGDCDQCDKAVEEVTIKAKLYKKMPDPFVNLKKIEVHDPSIDQLVEERKAQAEPEFGEWISVTEALPKTEDHVICCTETKNGRKNVVIGYYMDGWRCGMNSNVIAWMPLPEPYGGDV